MRQSKLTFYLLLSIIFILFTTSFLSAKPLISNSFLKGLKTTATGCRAKPIQSYKSSKISNRLADHLETKRKIKINKMRFRSFQSKNIEKNQTEMIRVVGEMEKGANLDQLLVKKYGGKILYSKGRYFGIEISGTNFTAFVDALKGSRFFRLPYAFEANEIIGAGVSTTGAITFHNDGITGEQVNIAVIDIGFKGLTDSINSNDIPETVISQDFTANGLQTEYEHGTACAEIIHEMAPGAQLHLLKISDDIEIALAFEYCVANNIDIISLSIGTFGSGPGDGTGPLHDICAYAEENGILVVASAGNYSVETDGEYTYGRHWEGVFRDWNNDGKHDFSYNSNYNVVVSAPGWNDDGTPLTNELTALLRWNDWPSASIDYDLHFYDFYTGEHIASSSIIQNGSAPPVEMIVIDIPDNVESQVIALEVTRKDGQPVGTELEIYLGKNSYFVPFQSRTDADATTESALGEPGDSPNVLTVGAIHNSQWTTGPQEDFSSQGPTNAWAGSIARTKPDIMGLDGVLTQVGETSEFRGTSAAAPHVAGAAALIKSKFSELNSTDLKSFLTYNAIDMGDEHKDNVYGWGRLNIENLQLHFTNIIPSAESQDLSTVLRDDFRDRIYVGDPANKKMLIIDTDTERVMNEVFFDSRFDDMAISKDGSTLAVAGGNLTIVDLETFQTNSYEPDPDIISVAFDYKGQVLYSRPDWSVLKLFDPQTGTSSKVEFTDCSGFSLMLDDGLVRTGPQGRNVYFASKSTEKIERYILSGNILSCSAENDHSDLDFIFDMVVSNDGLTVYTQTDILDSQTLEKISPLPIDASKLNSARSICLDRSGRQLHVGTGPYIERIMLDPVNVESVELKRDQIARFIESGGMDTERHGEKIFYIMGGMNDIQQVRVLKALKPIAVIMPEVVNETDGILHGRGMVSLLEITDQDLVVYLQSNSARVQVPEQIIISAGQKTAVFDIIITDNSLAEPAKLVQIEASSQGFDTVFTTMELKDDESVEITLQLPGVLTEGQTGTITGKVLLNHVAGDDFLVSLESSDISEIQVPGWITVPIGQSEVDFILDIQNDDLFDGSQGLIIKADIAGHDSAQADLTVVDNEIKEVHIICPDELTEGYLYENLTKISIPGIAMEDLIFNLSSSNTCRSALPLTTTILAGESAAFFDVDLPGETFRNHSIPITLEASAQGWSTGSKQLDIIDDWKITEPIQINSYTLESQETPSIVGLKNGGFVAVWVSEHQDGERDGIYAQIFDRNNNKVGTEFQVNTKTNWDPELPSVLGLSNGGFAVAWIWDKYSSEISIQFFNEHGVKVNEEIEITTNSSGSIPILTEFPNGQVAVTLKSYSWLHARFIDPETNTLGPELSLLSNHSSFVSSAKIAPISSNEFMTVSSYFNGESNEIIAQLFDQSGNASGDSFIVNTTSDGRQIKPEAVRLADGRIVVIWECLYSLEIKGRYFTSEGIASGDEFTIASPGLNLPLSSNYFGPSVLPLTNGGFVATWSLKDQGQDNGTFGQLFSPLGNKIGVPFKMASNFLSVEIDAGSLENNGWVITWSERESASTDTDLFTKQMSLDLDNDDDGIVDADEDMNSNGCIDIAETNPWLLDTDGDGIQDGTELSVVLSDVGPDTDLNIFKPDADPNSYTNPLSSDTDGDGYEDGEEDKNHNGKVDAGESDPDDIRSIRAKAGLPWLNILLLE